MALVSAGVSVTVTDESFFIPASAPTVPLIFIATADEKVQPDGTSPAQGTYEYNVIRTVTSLKQSTELYGVPRFLKDDTNPSAPVQHHGDARNEYGVFALNQFLGIGNKAYVARANVNLNDDIVGIRSMWDINVLQSQAILENLAQNRMDEIDALGVPAGSPVGSPIVYVPNLPGTTTTIPADDLQSFARTAMINLFAAYSFSNSETDFFGVVGSASALPIYAAGYDSAATGTYDGFDYVSANLPGSPSYPGGGTVAGEFTVAEAGAFLLAAADDYKYTQEFLNQTSLGANDAARRVTIKTALQSLILSNTEIRSESYDYNLVLCPGWYEVVDEMNALVDEIADEALVIADTPMDMNPEEVSTPSTGWGSSTDRVRSTNVAYYYPSALASNLDGQEVLAAASGVALRTYAYSDSVAFLWTPPAGIRRGSISGITNLGYASGILGEPNTFTEVALTTGQRNALYLYGGSGDINPLVFFPGKGFIVWGQKTSSLAASALDRVNVARLMAYVKRQLRRNTLSFVFEPNDQLTRDNLKAVVDSFLGDLIVKRGLYDFATISDTSNNTPDRIDRNEMYIDIALKPIKAAEFIYIPIRLLSTGADI